MAQYKVLQDIEAEDKLVGPLTLRQFIYAGITAICLYLCFIATTKHLLFALPIFLLPGLLTGFFAFPWGRDQPTEIWALAKIRFLFKPRRRIWNQSGIKELVTVTAPKKLDVSYTDGLSQTEVKSRLKALADTIDTRGWAVKNVTTGVYQPSVPGSKDADRLIDISNLPDELPTIAEQTNDMLDDKTSPTAQTIDTMMKESGEARRQNAINTISGSSEQNQYTKLPPLRLTTPPSVSSAPSTSQQQDDFWFMQQPPAMPTRSQVVAPSASSSDNNTVPTVADEELSDRLREHHDATDPSHQHQHTILPLSEQKALAEKAARDAEEARAKAAQASVTQPPDPAIIALANNNDLNVDTIARQAKRQNQEPSDEVVISLH